MKHASPSSGRRRRRDRAARSQQAGPAARSGDENPPGAGSGAAGSGAAGSGTGARRRLEQLPYWIVLCGTGLGLLSMRQGGQNVRRGTLEMAGVLLVAAVARLILPERRAGMLGSRRRLADVAAFAALGIGLLVAGLIYPAAA